MSRASQSSLFAFKPGTQPVAVNFWRVEDAGETTPLLKPTNLLVPPKKWARAPYPRPSKVLLAQASFHPPTQSFIFVVDSDDDVALLHLESSTNLVDWTSVSLPPASAGTRPSVVIPIGSTPGESFFRFRIPPP